MRHLLSFTALHLLLWTAEASAQLPCGTAEQLTHITARPPMGPAAPPDGHLEDRDPFSDAASRSYGTHFALKWGSTHPLSSDQAATMLGLLEAAHDAEVTDWSLPDPTGTDGTLFNVYIGDTGDEVPSVLGNGGYFTLDDDGFPYIVLNRHAVGEWAYMESIVLHEFFHAVQWATGAFSLTLPQRWYWEATATWAAGRLQPGHDFFYYWLPWYALRPTAALDHHSVDEYGGEPPDLHQYGAFILPWYISDHLDEEIVLSSWRDGEAGEDPLESLDTQLADVEIEDVLADQAAANLSWDYELSAGFDAQVREFEESFAHRDTRYTTATADEDDWWVHADAAPNCYGYHSLPLPEEALERVRLGLGIAMAIEADVLAGLPTTLRFRGRLVALEGGSATTHFIDSDADQTWMDVSPTADELWLVVVNTTPPHALRDTPAYRFRWVPMPEPPGDTGEPPDTGAEDTGTVQPEEKDSGSTPTPSFKDKEKSDGAGGCTCSTGGSPGLFWLGPMLLLLRRRSDSHPG
jgi:hypothetical protein